MFKLIRGKTTHATSERIKLQKELFSFNKTVTHGFPHHSSALAFDEHLNLLAIGTRHGLIRIYGKPGVEFQSSLDTDVEIRSLLFIENRAQLVSLSADNCLHLWQINSKQLENNEIGVLKRVKSCDYFSKEASKEGSLKQITTISINSSNDLVLIGTQSGNTYLLDLEKFDLSDQQIIYQDVVLQNIPDDYKFNPGSVEVIAEQPLHANKFLIGYNRGLLVLWDNNALSVDHFYVANQQLESVCWLYNGQQFISSHNDGRYLIWTIDDNLKPSEQPKTPYGPFPCKSINKIVWKTVQNRDDLVIFSGGMPRASYNDKNTVSIIEGTPENGKHHVLDFTSKVIDFYVIAPRNNDTDADNPTTLIVLVEEEIVLIDLTSPDWLQFRLPYLASVHSSAITCCQHYSDVSQELYQKIVNAGQIQNAGKFTSKEWPIIGGTVIEQNIEPKIDLLITGHEDGSVRFWDASTVSMHHLYTLSTSKFFLAIDDDITPIDSDDTVLSETNAEDEWPPFRKVGTFDPYSDDPRLAIRKVSLCVYNGTLIVAGTAGQVIVFQLQSQSIDKSLTSNILNIVGDKDGFIWKGHGQLVPKNGNIKFEIGFQPSTIIQLLPPAAVTSLSLHSEWGLVAAGTAHGFGLFDYIQQKLVITRTTLNPNDLTAASGGDALISRRKSFKKSLRESFRRLRKGRSQRAAKRTDRSPTPSSSSPAKSLEDSRDGRKSPRSDDNAAHLEAKPVERQIEARSSDDSMGSMVRCLYFAPAFIINNATQTPSLWAGTNAGTVLIFTITLPSDDKRNSTDIVCQLAKEIQLKHRAPVVAMQIVDANGLPLPDSFEVKSGKAKPASLPGHRILICSEEQFKLFNLPNLKPLNKYKLTAHEGARARRIGIARFVSKSNENHSEYCLLCLSNLGDISIFTIPELKRQLVTQCTKREDINGISSLVFTKLGEGFYLHSSCEFRRFSLSARHIVNSVCNVDLLKENPVSKQIENSSPTATSPTEEVSPESSEIEGIQSKESNNDETEETPTSGIGESPVTPNDLTLPEVNYDTLPNVTEILNHNEENLLNGTNDVDNEVDNEVDNNHSLVENGENGVNDDSLNLTNDSSIDKNNMDITIDSVKDHLTNQIHNSNNDRLLNSKS